MVNIKRYPWHYDVGLNRTQKITIQTCENFNPALEKASDGRFTHDWIPCVALCGLKVKVDPSRPSVEVEGSCPKT